MVSCIDAKPQVSVSAPQAAAQAGAIAFVTLDWNIAVMDGAGAVTAITDDANAEDGERLLRIYQYPTISADGKSLAFLETTTISGTEGVTQTILVAPLSAQGRPKQIYTTTEHNIPYVAWSPDGQLLSFLSINNDEGGTLQLANVSSAKTITVDRGSSVYWHWRSDSGALIAHVSGSASRNEDAHLSSVSVRADTPQAHANKLETLPGNFRSPQYSPDGKFMLLTIITGSGDELVIADDAGTPICAVAPIEAGAAYAWAPDGQRIAWVDASLTEFVRAPMEVLDLVTGEQTRMHDDAIAFFWSPDGQRLAVYSFVVGEEPVQLDAREGTGAKTNRPATQSDSLLLRIEIVDASTGRAIQVADTTPTREFVQVLGYFDQYSRALTPWSPDSQQLVFATLTRDRRSVDIGIATLDESAGRSDLRRLTAGLMAFWSPR